MKLMHLLSVCLLTVIVLMSSCSKSDKTKVMTQKDFPAPPVAISKADTFSEFGNLRIDNYFWLKEKSNPEVIEYLNAENAYCDTVMNRTLPLQNKLFEEMKGRIKEDDISVPQLEQGYYYYSRTEKNRQYPIYCRKSGNLDAAEQVIFDVNKMAEGFPAYIFTGYEVSDNGKIAAYAFNNTGSFASFTLSFKDLETGTDLPGKIENIQSFAWAGDNKTIFYTIGNEALRPYRVYQHKLGSAAGTDRLIYEEKDELFSVGLDRSKSREKIFIYSGSFTTTEVRMIDAAAPDGDFKIFIPRQKDVEYGVAHHPEKYFILYKDNDYKNSKVMEAPLTGFEDKKNWKELVPHDQQVKIENIEVFQQYLVMYVRFNGLKEIRVMNLADKSINAISFPEPVYTLSQRSTPEFNSTKLRYAYQSLNRPSTIYDYLMDAKTSEKLKEQEIPSGFNPDDYTVERHWAVAPDGTKVPMALIFKKDLKRNGEHPALLYSYGSYGYSTDAWFNSNAFSLIDRGFVYALAQIRGGSEMGESWYEDGKLMKKKNTFTDFIACAEYLVNEKFTSSDKLAIMGGSAGGLLVGAVVNMRPDLFKVALALVPFVDVINTMLDSSLPLTTQEYEQWGNPNEKEAYEYIMSYSPYDNIQAQNYPNILATAGLNDSQVSYHEPAKWVAKLRSMKTDDNIVLLKTNMDSGHGGATGRFDSLKETAFEYTFILDRTGFAEK